MPDAYDIHDCRLIEYGANASAANGLVIGIGPVPENKVWTIFQASGFPSVAETRYVWFSILGRDAIGYQVTMPLSIALDPAVVKYAACTTEGMELRIYPGEYIRFHRDVATAGSTIAIYIRYISTDLPFYQYIEPQVRKSITRATSSFLRSAGGGARASMGIAPPSGGGGGGGRER